MSVLVILQQTAIIFAYVAIGWVLAKSKVAGLADTPLLSRLILTLTMPLSILAATSIEAAPADLWNMLIMGLFIGGMILAATCVSLLAAKRRRYEAAERAIFTGLCAYPNVGFMGIPLCTALMGAWGSLYGAAAVSAYNVLFFTLQAAIFQPGKKLDGKSFLTPLNICTAAAIVMLALRLHLPAMVQTVCTNVGNITTPLALILIGIMLGSGRLLDVFRGKFGYEVTLIRNVLWPLALLALLAFLPLDRTMRLALMVYAATPCANLTAIFATRYEMEPQLCGRAILLSTLASIATMPAILVLAETVL
ncbi:MAG: AEC family transporter [Faecalibacterium sp.]|jgi:predicted permease|nr:AEC family transporter [Faecalibacterium sp.]